jgi:signal peptidase
VTTVTDPESVEASATSEPVDTTANRRARRRIVDGVLYTIGLAAFLVAAWFLWPVRWGGTFAEVVVSGHSMEPTYHTGDLVVTKKEGHYRVGESVVYQIPKGEPGAGIHVVHRVIGYRPDGTLVMQGDNRVTPDNWRPRSRDVLGHVVTVVPNAGKALLWLAHPWVLAALCGLITAVWLWPEPKARRGAPVEAGATDEGTRVRIEHMPIPPPRTDPWWADEPAPGPYAGQWWSAAGSTDADRSDHSMPSAPDSSEWDAITTSASTSSESSS